MSDCRTTTNSLKNDSMCQTFAQKTKRLFHWAPIVALFIIFFIATITTNCIVHICHPFSNVNCFIHFSIYVYEFYAIMSNYLNASFIGPGYVRVGWQPQASNDRQYLQYCQLCDAYKPPRAHHCRKCDRCVMKMDHHCPWINTCCGHLNHGYFVYFLWFAPVGCLHSVFLLGLTLYYAIYLEYFLIAEEEQLIIVLSLMEFLCSFFACGLAIGVVIAVGSLWLIQIKSIMKNETGVESWIKEKAQMRHQQEHEEQQEHGNNNSEHAEFIYPYDLGRWNNIRQVITWSGKCKGDGINWVVREGCGQYDLTMEQIRQKRDKVLHSQHYEIKRAYNGSLIPFLSFGWRVAYGSPCTDEHRMPVTPGQVVMVTRWRKHWLYGQLITITAGNTGDGDGDKCSSSHVIGASRRRGWFPAVCAKQVSLTDQNFHADRNGNLLMPVTSSRHTKLD